MPPRWGRGAVGACLSRATFADATSCNRARLLPTRHHAFRAWSLPTRHHVIAHDFCRRIAISSVGTHGLCVLPRPQGASSRPLGANVHPMEMCCRTLPSTDSSPRGHPPLVVSPEFIEPASCTTQKRHEPGRMRPPRLVPRLSVVLGGGAILPWPWEPWPCRTSPPRRRPPAVPR